MFEEKINGHFIVEESDHIYCKSCDKEWCVPEIMLQYEPSVIANYKLYLMSKAYHSRECTDPFIGKLTGDNKTDGFEGVPDGYHAPSATQPSGYVSNVTINDVSINVDDELGKKRAMVNRNLESLGCKKKD